MGGLPGLGSARMIFRNSIALAALLAAACCPVTWAQSPAPAAQPAPAPAQAPLILERLALVEQGEAGDQFQPPETGGFVVASPGLSRLNVAELNLRLAAGKGQPITEQLLAAITQVIETAIRPDFPLAAAVIVPQKVQNGVLRVTIALLKIRDVKFVGNRWFSSSLLQNRLQVSKGEIIQISDLDQGLKWTNNSPYRRVQVRVDQIPNTNEANLIFGVEDKLPLRLTATADTSGNTIIGRNRLTAGLAYGNLLGKEHELSYTYITTDLFDVYQAHALNYRIPFEKLRSLQISAAYALATPTIFGAIDQKARNLNVDIRYTSPLRTGNNPIEAFASVSFKRSNNNLEFSGTGEEGLINRTSTDIVQATLGTSAIWRDPRGAWAASLSATGSPGRLTPYNNDRYFAGVENANGSWDIDFARYGSKAQYAYASFALQRYQMMPFGWELTVRSAFQASTANLLSSEQFSLGGATTVRGYQESIVGGDKGYVINTELITPTWRHPLPGKLTKLGTLEARGLFFFDFGDTAEYTLPSRLAQPPLASAGIGIRAALPGHASLTADYGFQLTELRSATPQGTIMTSGEVGRGHVKLIIAF